MEDNRLKEFKIREGELLMELEVLKEKEKVKRVLDLVGEKKQANLKHLLCKLEESKMQQFMLQEKIEKLEMQKCMLQEKIEDMEFEFKKIDSL